MFYALIVCAFKLQNFIPFLPNFTKKIVNSGLNYYDCLIQTLNFCIHYYAEGKSIPQSLRYLFLCFIQTNIYIYIVREINIFMITVKSYFYFSDLICFCELPWSGSRWMLENIGSQLKTKHITQNKTKQKITPTTRKLCCKILSEMLYCMDFTVFLLKLNNYPIYLYILCYIFLRSIWF